MFFQYKIIPKRENWELCDVNYEEIKNLEKQDKEDNNITEKYEKEIVNLTLLALETIIKGKRNEVTHEDYLKQYTYGYLKIFLEPKNMEHIGTRENKIMRKMLEKKLENDKIKKIGIIYGAGHGPGIKKLIKSFGFEEVERMELSTF